MASITSKKYNYESIFFQLTLSTFPKIWRYNVAWVSGASSGSFIFPFLRPIFFPAPKLWNTRWIRNHRIKRIGSFSPSLGNQVYDLMTEQQKRSVVPEVPRARYLFSPSLSGKEISEICKKKRTSVDSLDWVEIVGRERECCSKIHHP